MRITKISKILAFMLLISGSAMAVPQLEVSSEDANITGVNESIYAHQDYVFNFTLSNNASDEKIFNVSLPSEPEYLEWSENNFDLNASENRTVSARINTNEPGMINESFSIPYKFNQTVNNESELTFDKNYYPSIRFLLDSSYRSTSVDHDSFDTEFELDFDEKDSSILKLENTGSETAYNVQLEGTDMEFQRSGFDIPAGEDVFVEFNVSIPMPDENATGKSNQTYQRDMLISGENFQDKSFAIDVFVPFKKYGAEDRQQDILEKFLDAQQDLQVFCQQDKFEDTYLCGGEIVKYKNRTVNETVYYQTNLTEEERDALKNIDSNYESYQTLLERFQLLKQRVESNNQNLTASEQERYNQQMEKLDKLITEVKVLKAEEEQTQEQREKENQGEQTVGLIVVSFFILIGLGGGFIAVVKKIQKASNDHRMIK